MQFITYYQESSEGKWFDALEDLKEQITRAKNPMLWTILSQYPQYDDSMTKEDSAKIRYKGPFYADFDCKEEDGGLAVVIKKFNEFLSKLEALDVHLDQVELYATGGRGFHALVPQKVFLPKPPPSGIVFLPHIYKEMAFSSAITVNTLDLAIYSGRRGRMLRSANVKRANGRFKVSITVDEARAMTPEKYVALTSQPRTQVPVAEPTLSPAMALEFSKASDKVSAGAKARSSSKLDTKLVDQFKGEFPPSMVAIMKGETKEGVGFNVLAMQLACAANALGKPLGEFLEACAGLIATHESDGTRYNSPRKRRDELERLYKYTNDSVTYQFSAGGLRSCAKEGASCPDLRDTEGEDLTEDGEINEAEAVEETGMMMGVHVSRLGIFRKIDGIRIQKCEIGLANVQNLVEASTGDCLGYELDAYHSGKFLRRATLDASALLNNAKFKSFISSFKLAGSSMDEKELPGLMTVLSKKAEGAGTIYTVGQEGVDIVQIRGSDGKYREEQFYISKDGIISYGDNKSFKLRSAYHTEAGQLNCDIHAADHLIDTPKSREFFRKFLRINSLSVVARCFGWYSAAFISPMIRHIYDQYPLLQVVGQAGAGKSKYTSLLMALYYYKQRPHIFSASNVTAFALDSTLNASSSIPIVFDELKATEIDKRVHDRLKTAFRSNYTGLKASKGRVDHSKVKDALSTVALHNRAPLTFIGEALESQTAIVDRCVIVNLSERDRRGTEDDFEFCLLNREILSSLGRSCVDAAIRTDMERLKDAIATKRKAVHAAMPARASNVDRPAFNFAIPLIGLDFVKSVLKGAFKGAFDEVFGDIFERMQDEVLSNLSEYMPKNMSEGSKVLNTLAHMSKHGREDHTKLVVGEDYMFFADPSGRECIDLKLRVAYDKYRLHVRSLGEEALYSNYEAMAAGLRSHPAVVSRTCFDNPEFKGEGTGSQMYRFDLARMAGVEGIEDFDAIPVSAVVLEFPKQK